MSAFGGKADVNHQTPECPLIAISGHRRPVDADPETGRHAGERSSVGRRLFRKPRPGSGLHAKAAGAAGEPQDPVRMRPWRREGKHYPCQVEDGQSQNDETEVGATEFAKHVDDPFAPASRHPPPGGLLPGVRVLRMCRRRAVARVDDEPGQVVDRASCGGDPPQPQPYILPCGFPDPDPQGGKEKGMDRRIDEVVEMHAQPGSLVLEAGDLAVAVVQHVTYDQEDTTNDSPRPFPLHHAPAAGHPGQQGDRRDLVGAHGKPRQYRRDVDRNAPNQGKHAHRDAVLPVAASLADISQITFKSTPTVPNFHRHRIGFTSAAV